MAKKSSFRNLKLLITPMLFVLWFGMINSIQASSIFFKTLQQDAQSYNEYKGVVVDGESGEKLVSATLVLENSNISTVTNTDGEFLLKVPSTMVGSKVIISSLGYNKKTIALSEFTKKKTRIKLTPSVIELVEVNVNLPADAKTLVKEVFRKKEQNYSNDGSIMTAFYRETIKKRKKNVSLSEAVVNVYKQPYSIARKDMMKLYKSRKSTDYTRLDTVAVKLQGGPFSTLYLDVMKYPEYIFSYDAVDNYNFKFDKFTEIDDQLIYVVKFKQRKDIVDLLYYGKLYINAETLALIRADYSINIEDKKRASELFVKKKPKDVKAYPTEVSYHVDYREKNGKWYYGYSNVQLAFKVNKKSKLFSSTYKLSCEMAVTDWELNPNNINVKSSERLKSSIIISDEASGFSDPEFWGEYNVIEPEKSIESAIKKIKRKLNKIERKGDPVGNKARSMKTQFGR